MATTFSVGVLITAKDQASSVIKAVSHSVKSLTAPIGSLVSGLTSLKGMAMGLATGWVASKGIEQLTSFLERTGEIKDFSNQIGWAAEDLQRWRYAASQAGVKGEDFDGSIQKMTRTMGEFHNKSGELYKFLTKTGDVKFIKQLQKASGTQALDLLIGKMEQIPSAETRATLSMAVFGRGGLGMVRLAVEGRESLHKMMLAADRLGIVLSTKDVNAAEEFGDHVETMKLALQGVGNTIFTKLVPGLDKGTGSITEWIVANRELVAGKVVSFLQDVWAKASQIGDWVNEHKDEMWTTFVTGAELVGKVVKSLGDLLATVNDIPGGFTAMSTAFIAAVVAMNGDPRVAAFLLTIGAVAAVLDAMNGTQIKVQSDRAEALYGAPILPMSQMRKEEGKRAKVNEQAAAENQAVASTFDIGSIDQNSVLHELFRSVGAGKSTPDVVGGEVLVHVVTDQGTKATTETKGKWIKSDTTPQGYRMQKFR